MYDFAHCLSDSIEGITHSICTLEFENHRPLYDWFLDELGTPCHPQQIEFARLNLSLHRHEQAQARRNWCEKGYVSGWDDPRMPTISGLRRRGYTPEAIREFCERIGVAKRDSIVDMALLEHCIREDLNQRAPRVMAVLRASQAWSSTTTRKARPRNWTARTIPKTPVWGSRKVPFSRVLYIEQDDFHEEPPKDFFRLAPGREVRLRYAYFIKCERVVKDEKTGEVVKYTAPMTPQRGTAMRRTGERSRPPSTGSRLRTRYRPRCACMTASSPWRTPMQKRKRRGLILPPS